MATTEDLMIKHLLALAFALTIGSSAFAQNAAPAAQDAAPTQQTSTCKDVKFMRADVGSKKEFTITFKGADLNAIKSCNPQAQIDQTQNGVRVLVTYGQDGAAVSLPASMSVGNAHTARCVPDQTGSVADTALYRADWNEPLPAKIELKLIGKDFYDADAALATCKRLAVAQKLR
jgi:hypothetical protein